MTSKQITITATSGGNYGGNKAQISVDGKEIGFGNYSRGINVAVFDETTGQPNFSTSFTPIKYQGFDVISDGFVDFIDSLPAGRIVALAVQGDAGYATDKAKAAFKAIGSSEIDQLQPGGQSFALIGIKGHAPGTAHESIDWLKTATSSYSFDVEAVKATGGFVVEAISKPSTMAGAPYYQVTGGVAELKVSGNALSIKGGTSSGWNLAVLDRKSGAVKTSGSFDPNQEVDKFVETIQDLEPGDIVAIATQDYAGTKVEQKVIKACASIGSTMVGKLKYGGNWAIVGYKGAKPGKAAENLSSYAPPQDGPQGVAVKYWELPTEPVKKELKVGQQLFLNDASYYFGDERVGIDGDYAIVGDYEKNNASMYCWHDGQWQLQQQLVAHGLTGSRFGYKVAISGNWAIVSDYCAAASGKSYCGAAHIYELKKGQWQHQQILQPSDLKAQDYFGWSVAIDGKKVIVGADRADAPGKGNCGAAYIFHQENGKWVQKGRKLQPLDLGASDYFGCSVSINGDVAIVGAHYADALSGAAYIFHWEKGQWQQQRKLQPLDLGSDNIFGNSVAVAGNLAIVGAHGADVSGKINTGAAYIYQLQDGEWQLHQKIFASDPNSSDCFGYSVAIGKDIALVGAHCADDKDKADCGAVYLFQLVNNKWEQKQKLQPSQLPAKARWGCGIDFDGSRAIVGAFGGYLTPKTGFAYICDLTEEA